MRVFSCNGIGAVVHGVLFATGLTLPVLVGAALQVYEQVSTAALGAMFALLVSPRHRARVRIAGIAVAGLLVVASAGLGAFLEARHAPMLPMLLLLSWAAALPRPDQAYLGLVVKYTASAMLLITFGFSPSPAMAGAFFAGLGLGIGLSLIGMRFEETGNVTPLQELHAFLDGARNSALFGLAVPVTVLLSTLAARRLQFADPAWVGLTVLYVMHSDGATELFRIWARALGTLLGVLVSAAVLYTVTDPWHIAAFLAAAAFSIPFAQGHYIPFSFCITCVVLLLIDVAMYRHGGDFFLLRWRLIDTVFAGVCVLLSNMTLRLIRRMRERAPSALE